MTPAGRVCVQCVTLSFALGAAAFTGSAYAQGAAVAAISPEFWLGLVFTVLFSLVAGYAKGLSDRVRALEFEQKNKSTELSLFMQTLPLNYYTKAEQRELQTIRDLHTAEHRERMEQGVRDVKDCVAAMNSRLDNLARGIH